MMGGTETMLDGTPLVVRIPTRLQLASQDLYRTKGSSPVHPA